MIKLLIADDHQILLDGFKSIFDSIEDIEVIGLAHDGLAVLEQLKEKQPDLILIDIKMPNLNGVETCKKVIKKYPGIKVIALSMHDQMSFVKRMFQFGASGYLLKNDSAEIIEKAIRQVMDGGQFLSPQIENNLNPSLIKVNSGSENDLISEREKEVLLLVAEGNTDGQIATQLFLSVHTVNSHRKRLLSKFNAKNSAELVKICMERGII